MGRTNVLQRSLPDSCATRAVAVAYSGGRDSTALLHATVQAALPLGMRVLALHVHHGLSDHAEDWLAHCQTQCVRWQRRGWPVTFACVRLAGQPSEGESVEAWARDQRYRALHAMATEHGVNLVLLAQHQRDQAETLLLQALRGAGVAGLSGMPRSVDRGDVTWVRPWLSQSRESIDAYVRQHRLKFVDDDSNADTRFARNRLRLQVWPALHDAFAHAETALAMSAQWAHEASLCLQDLASLDLQQLVNGSGGLSIDAWRQLSAPRRANALRFWLKAQQAESTRASLTSRMLVELESARAATWPCAGGRLRLYRGTLVFQADPIPVEPQAPEQHLSVLRGGDYNLPGWNGKLRVRRCKEDGVPLDWLAHLELRQRSGGEQFQAGVGRPARSLKKQFQAAAIPQWHRTGPLFYSGGQLIFVPGLGLDARVLALPGQPQVRLEWRATD